MENVVASEPPKRKPFQFHLSTAFVVMCVAGLLLGILIRYVFFAGVTQELMQIEFSDPTTDAKTAIANKDFHFIGIYGYGLAVPSVDGEFALQKKYGVHPVAGTSDCIQSPGQWRLQHAAYGYAAKYNQLVLDAIKSGKNP